MAIWKFDDGSLLGGSVAAGRKDEIFRIDLR